jgi:zinc protease
VTAVSTPGNWQQAGAEILRAVYRLREELVAPEELAKAKKQKAAELVFAQQTVQQAADSLGRNAIATHDPLFDRHYTDQIQKVTAEEIRRAARRYFTPQRLNRVIIAPPGGAPKPKAAPSALQGRGARLERLPNGLRVLVQRHANLPLVNVQAYVLGGALVDTPETAGRSALVAEMLDKGNPRMSAAEIAEYFDSIGAKFSTGAGRNSVFAGMTVLRDDFPRAAGVLADCFLRPAFPQDQFEKVQQLALGQIAQRRADAEQEAFELFFDSLPADTPYHVIEQGTEASLRRLSADELRRYHARYFVPNNMIVTVFGDVEPEAALAMVREQFGALRPDPAFVAPRFDRPNALPRSIERRQETGKPTGIVVLGYPGVSLFDKSGAAALTLLDAIMSGYHYPGGWLFEELRGEGLVYAVDATLITGPAPGYFVIFAQTQPDKVAEVVRRIRKDVARARAGQITQEEFDAAQNLVIAMHAQEHTTIESQAQLAALFEAYGLGYDYDRTFDQRIRAVTRDDVIRAARTYLDRSVLVTTAPKE